MRQRPLTGGSEEAGRNKVNISAPTNYQPKGVRECRAAFCTAKAKHNVLRPDGALGLLGVRMAARFYGTIRNRRGPTWQPASGKDLWYKAVAESQGAGRESEGFIVPWKSGKPDGGKEPCIGQA